MRKILLIDDHEVVRAGVRRILDRGPGETEFGEASTPTEAMECVRQHVWDVIVLDLSLGGRDGLEVLREIKKVRPRQPVLVLSMHAEELFARRALKAGASGYITKNTPRAELSAAVDKVSRGGTYVSPALAETLAFDLRGPSDGPVHQSLSNREFEVLRLIASGKTVSEVAELLHLSVGTISTYRARILEKMGLKTNAELTYYALQKNLVD